MINDLISNLNPNIQNWTYQISCLLTCWQNTRLQMTHKLAKGTTFEVILVLQILGWQKTCDLIEQTLQKCSGGCTAQTIYKSMWRMQQCQQAFHHKRLATAWCSIHKDWWDKIGWLKKEEIRLDRMKIRCKNNEILGPSIWSATWLVFLAQETWMPAHQYEIVSTFWRCETHPSWGAMICWWLGHHFDPRRSPHLHFAGIRHHLLNPIQAQMD